MAQVLLNRPIELPYQVRSSGAPTITSEAGTTMDAAAEEVHLTGYLLLEDPDGGAKTISSAGGKIHWLAGAATVFANASTILNVGIQDTSLVNPAQGDGVFDVSAQLVGGTDTIAASTYKQTAMESGSKSITNGQLLTIAFQMSARGGVDAVVVNTAVTDNSSSGRTNIPSVVQILAGVGTIVTTATPIVGLEFDDGTIGWLMSGECLSNFSTQSYGADTSPDEFGNFIQLPAPMVLAGISGIWSLTNASSDYELRVYSNPLVTPTVIATATLDATQDGSLAVGRRAIALPTPILLERDTPYAITLRPTTTNNVSLRYMDFGNVKFNKMNSLGNNCYAISRVDLGAFSDFNGGTAKSRTMHISGMFRSVANDDGTGAGGTGASGGFNYIQS